MAKTLFILNDPPYGTTERSYNALRLAGSLSKRESDTSHRSSLEELTAAFGLAPEALSW
jgi:sulfur relay (sulfurtransferase) complex TusBCD TusD component (DsrE family)